MRIIAFCNQKGGTGKTTSVVNIGAALTKLNQKVLLIDLDPQAHLTESLGLESDTLEKTVYDLLKGARLKDVIQGQHWMTIVPSNIDLSGAEIELSSIPGREFLLRENLGPEGFDYCLIDCPPSLGLLTINALTAATDVIIPVQTEYLALRGLAQLRFTFDAIQRRLNPGLEIAGIIGTRYDNRKVLNRDIVKTLQKHFGKKLFKTLIRENISLAEAPGFGQTIFDYKPKSSGAEDYLKLAKEIRGRINAEKK